MKIRPRLWQAWANRGLALSRLGRRTDALDSLRRALKLAPGKLKPKLQAMIEKLGGN